MDFNLSSEQKLLRDSIVKFARGELNHEVIERDRAHSFPRDLWRKCAAVGLLGLPVSEEYGGIGADPLSCAIALEALGYGCRDGGLVFSICAHVLACAVPVWQHGSAAQKDRYLHGLCDGTLIGAHAITEPDSGSDTFAMRLRAERTDDGWRLNGSKTFISNGPVADVVVVFAVTDPDKGFHGGVTAFLIERGLAGFSTGQRFAKMGLRTSPVGELVFEDAIVPDDAVLGTVGGGASVFGTAMDWERSLLVAAHVGTIERLLDTSISYARTRSQFGQAIGKFQAVSHKIADMKVQLEAARLLVYRTASRLTTTRSISLDAAVTKLFVSESLVKTALDAVQLHGGYGFMEEYEVERALRDAIGSTLYSGTSEMQRNIIARWLGV
ncbi:MAG: Acyl-CoA dehydrogenase [Candidatus Accumulibacter appositus]|uniref:Acyl-CoA dehydrogenase n=1 Tax=Candidatus Accumulibacter appositus TaxID=1454003 RepID=A0A011NUN9_9PROT|nr:acyl-CoA dehydrogenase family protein [Accumulibacter sp.]EXI79051.1 MAG: Acyl-CoA dehydrogenase [Candidatus Accumulibacter appositus]HRF03193.1 acyl-CoA dehydrogenase family protein [Accumulibacter sp.]